MTFTFADSTYFLALLNRRDAYHEEALKRSQGSGQRLVTTAWVLTEVLDALSQPDNRVMAAEFARGCDSREDIIVEPPTQALFDGGLRLFADRPDKDWSLTDCISFVVMREHGIREALTADHHFEQAGFEILLK